MPNAVKSILAMLNRPADMAAILGWANRLARDFDAAADGAFLRYDPAASDTIFVDGFGYFGVNAAINEIVEASARTEAAAVEEFERAARRGPRSRLGAFHAISNGMRGGLARLARRYDLAVTHLPDETTRVEGEAMLAELLLRGGAPVFAVPRACDCVAPLQVALVAWDESLEASRAVRAALPFLKECRKVHLRRVEERRAGEPDLESLSRYLALHGVEADAAIIPAAGSVGRALLDEAERLAADFTVMGAFGQAPWREQLFGGATQAAITSSRKPVLLAN